jgi:asparagine synthase (glutamine-hydrolysing)
MCGIAGIVCPDLSAGVVAERIGRMGSVLSHRGPDDAGFYAADGVGLAHARLSIIDLEGGRQPLANEDQTIFLVANGEIYNFRNLRQTLASRGHQFRTASDCEVIVHLYEQYGEDCVDRLEGMFAFALWDANQRKLMLARDRFGIKPLYLARLKGGFCFASELTAIVRSGLIAKEIDLQALYAYMALSYVTGPLSIIQNVKKIQPSERVVLRNGSVQREIYWRPRKVTVPRTRSKAVEELSGRLEESVRAHLVSDVPVAAFLSGGVDSSTIVALAVKHADIETFCASFPGTEVDEAPFARRVARDLGTRHHETVVEFDPVGLLLAAVGRMDEPFADSSALPTFAVCQAARQIAKVVLSGDGGDEVFGGYTGRYRVASLKAVLPYPDRLAQLLRQIPPWRTGKRQSTPRMLDLAALPEYERYVLEREITSATQRAELFGKVAVQHNEPKLREIAAAAGAEGLYNHPVKRALWTDIQTSLPDDILTKVDRMSMAHGLEVRVPFLDHHLVEFALSMPSSWLVSPWPVEGKRILRQAAAPLVDSHVLNRAKHGFIVPLNAWMRDYFLPIFDDICLAGGSHICNFFDRNAILTVRKRPFDHTVRADVYALLVLELWLRQMN